MKFYVYIHRRASDGKVFYVGKGHSKRAFAKDRNRFWQNTFEKHGLKVEVLEHFESELEAFKREIELIAKFKADGHPLANLTDGGEGASNPAPQVKAKRSASLKKTLSSPEQKLRLSNQSKLRHSLPGAKELDAARANDLWSQEEFRAKMSAAKMGNRNACGNTNLLGYKFSEASKAKMSAAKLRQQEAYRAWVFGYSVGAAL